MDSADRVWPNQVWPSDEAMPGCPAGLVEAGAARRHGRSGVLGGRLQFTINQQPA